MLRLYFPLNPTGTHIVDLLAFLTGSTKISLIAYDCRFDFSSQTQSFMNHQISQSRFERYTFAGCFFPSPLASLASGLGP